MVDCPRTDIRDVLPDLVHDQLDTLARARVEQHVAECAECAAELELLRSLRSSVFVAPDVDAGRVAAAVHAAARADREHDVTPISTARDRRRESSRSVRPARRQAWYAWRAAAGIAAVAVGIGGYAMSHGYMPARSVAGEMAPMAAAPAPASAPVATASKTTAVADNSAGAGEPASGTLILGDALSDLSESDMQALLQAVDDLEAMPEVDPHPLPLLTRVVEGAL